MDQAPDASNGIVDYRTVNRFELGIPGSEATVGRKLFSRDHEMEPGELQRVCGLDDLDVEDSKRERRTATVNRYFGNIFSSGLQDVALPHALQPHSCSARAGRAPRLFRRGQSFDFEMSSSRGAWPRQCRSRWPALHLREVATDRARGPLLMHSQVWD